MAASGDILQKMTKESFIACATDDSIVPMTMSDIDEVWAIEQGISLFPWVRAHFADSMAAGHRGWVLRDAGGVKGYVITSVVLDEAELLIIGVARAHQGQGRGGQLMQAMMRALQEAGVKRLFLEVRESNIVAQSLYRRCGFEPSGRRAAYYPAPGGCGREAALLMTRDF